MIRETRESQPMNVISLVGSAALLASAVTTLFIGGQDATAPGTTPVYDAAFWEHWGDGQAEMASYDLRIMRYGEERKGTAVAIFVTEPFSNAVRVKSDGGRAKGDQFPVLKLNLVKDFPTGVYDYNMMASTFVALTSVNGRPAGTATKVSFSSQEWCGHVYHQLLFDKAGVREQIHSYFDGEADKSETLKARAGGISEDALFMWARGLAYPRLKPGESISVPMLMSIQHARLNHKPVAWTEAKLSRSKQGSTQEVPAGSFEVETLTAALGDRTWTFHVELAAPHRLIKWACTSGESGELVGAERMKYWDLKGTGGKQALKRIGLKPRDPRTP